MKKLLILRFASLVFMLLATAAITSGCKDKTKKSTDNTAKVEAQNKQTCETNFGTYANKICSCRANYEKIASQAYKCQAIPVTRQLCTDGTTYKDANGNCPTGGIQASNPQDCYTKSGFWNGSTCTRTAPTTQDACNQFGDNWNGGTCTRKEPNTKRAICQQRGAATWNDSTGLCTCQDSSNYDWRLQNCSGSVGKGYDQGNYTPDQLCVSQQGQWDGQNCQCPQYSQFNSQSGVCEASNGNYQGNCPGQYDQYNNCIMMTGEQMVYSILFGWITQAMYLDSGDNKVKKTDGH